MIHGLCSVQLYTSSQPCKPASPHSCGLGSCSYARAPQGGTAVKSTGLDPDVGRRASPQVKEGSMSGKVDLNIERARSFGGWPLISFLKSN